MNNIIYQIYIGESICVLRLIFKYIIIVLVPSNITITHDNRAQIYICVRTQYNLKAYMEKKLTPLRVDNLPDISGRGPYCPG